MKINRRFAALALLSTMTLAQAAPAFAVDEAPKNTTTITGTYTEIPLKVTVPTTGDVKINPYGLPVTLSEGATISGEQLLTAKPLMIQNRSEVALKVGASLNVTIASTATDLTLGTVSAVESENKKASGADKKMNVQLEVFSAPGVVEDNASDSEAVNGKFAALTSENAEAAVEAKTVGSAAIGKDLIILNKGNAEGGLQDGGAAFFRIAGTVTKNPDAAKKWDAAKDKFTATVTFTFEPDTYAIDATATGALTAAGNVDTIDAATTAGVVVTLDDTKLKLPTGVTIKADTIEWSTVGADGKLSVTVDATDAKKATVKSTAASGTTKKGKIKAIFEGSDKKVYCATLDMTATG